MPIDLPARLEFAVTGTLNRQGGGIAADDAARRDLAPFKESPPTPRYPNRPASRRQWRYTASLKRSPRLALNPRCNCWKARMTVLWFIFADGGRAILMAGADITASTSNVTRMAFDFASSTEVDFGGFWSELRTDVRVGFSPVPQPNTTVSLIHFVFLQPHLWDSASR